ncbi:uncharacterized protein LOC135139448 [Zophobas morio]|uniref:uncharacterized protein LOC135139448 n=1 Tax=Zophobas morio TaxID=2755281 RepID=UPI003083C768
MYTTQTSILTITLLITAKCASPNVSLTVPPAAKISDTVTLGCKLDSSEGTLQEVKWFKDGTAIFRYKPTEVPPGKSFNVPGINLELDKCDSSQIVISNVQSNDTGVYGCEVSTEVPFFRSSLQTAFMYVLDVPEESPSVRYYIRNSDIRAECASPASDPPINITWVVNNSKTFKGTDTYISTHTNATGNHPRMTLSVLELPYYGSYNYRRAKIRCVANLFHLYHKEAEFVAYSTENFDKLEFEKKETPYTENASQPLLELIFVIYMLAAVIALGVLYWYVLYKS